MTARPLFKVDRERRIADLLAANRWLRAELAEQRRQTNKFHALLIAERVAKIGAANHAPAVPGTNPHQEGHGPLVVDGMCLAGDVAAPTTNTTGPGRTSFDGTSAAGATGGSF